MKEKREVRKCEEWGGELLCSICGLNESYVKLLKVSYGRALKSIPVCISCMEGNTNEISEEIRTKIIMLFADSMNE